MTLMQITTFAAAWLAVSTITGLAIGAFIRAGRGEGGIRLTVDWESQRSKIGAA